MIRCSSCSASALYRITRTDGEDFDPPIYACEIGGRSIPSAIRVRLSAPRAARHTDIPAALSITDTPFRASRTSGDELRGAPSATAGSGPDVSVPEVPRQGRSRRPRGSGHTLEAAAAVPLSAGAVE